MIWRLGKSEGEGYGFVFKMGRAIGLQAVRLNAAKNLHRRASGATFAALIFSL